MMRRGATRPPSVHIYGYGRTRRCSRFRSSDLDRAFNDGVKFGEARADEVGTMVPDKASNDYAGGFVDGMLAARRESVGGQVEQYLRDITEDTVD